MAESYPYPIRGFHPPRTPPEAGRKKLAAALVSVGVNLFLIGVKLMVAVTTGSLGILAEVGHSAADLSASGLAYWGIRRANAPPDPEHPYGHEKYENLSSLAQMVLLGAICFFVFYEVGDRLLFGFTLKVTGAAIAVMGAALVIDFFTARFLQGRARAYGSPALEADAYHFRADFWSSMAVLLGLAGARLGYDVLDPLAAAVVAAVMLYAAIQLGGRTTRALVDASPGPQMEGQVRAIISSYPFSLSFHTLRLRQVGSQVFLDLCLHVSSDMSIGRPHQAAHEVSCLIKEVMPTVHEVLVHVEPAEHEMEPDEEEVP